jgi:hypothetical protein
MKNKSVTYSQITSKKTPKQQKKQQAKTPQTPKQKGSGLAYFKPDHEQNRVVWKMMPLAKRA